MVNSVPCVYTYTSARLAGKNSRELRNLTLNESDHGFLQCPEVKRNTKYISSHVKLVFRLIGGNVRSAPISHLSMLVWV